MTEHAVHTEHAHVHGPDCGHEAVAHADHTDYLHEGHLHHPHGDHVDEHVVDVAGPNVDDCTPGHDCAGHGGAHVHGPECGHEEVPHGGHTDYLTEGHLHQPHAEHCDDHGPLVAV